MSKRYARYLSASLLLAALGVIMPQMANAETLTIDTSTGSVRTISGLTDPCAASICPLPVSTERIIQSSVVTPVVETRTVTTTPETTVISTPATVVVDAETRALLDRAVLGSSDACTMNLVSEKVTYEEPKVLVQQPVACPAPTIIESKQSFLRFGLGSKIDFGLF